VFLAVLFSSSAVPAQIPLIESVTSGDRAVLLTFRHAPGDTMTIEERARIASRTFAGYRVWRRVATGEEPFTLLREYSLVEPTWTFVGEERVFLDPDSILARRNPPADEEPDIVVAGPVNGIKYNYSVTWFEATLDTSVIPPRPEFFPADEADVLASMWPEVVTPSDFARTATPLLAEVRVVPNPYDPSAAYGKQVFPGPPRVQFTNLPSPADIDVFTAAGDIVVSLRHEGPTSAVDWDLKNGQGQNVASGLYVYRVVIPSGEATTGRFVVVR
jgi:hypothetical protein